MSGSSSSIFTCYSTGSPATIVSWTVKNGLVLTMKDGNSTTVEGINYQLTQTVNNRSESSYTNVLTINTPSVENIFDYQCGVMNALGNSDMVNVTSSGNSFPIHFVYSYMCKKYHILSSYSLLLTHIYACMHTCIHACTHTYMHTHTPTHTDACIHTHIHLHWGRGSLMDKAAHVSYLTLAYGYSKQKYSSRL